MEANMEAQPGDSPDPGDIAKSAFSGRVLDEARQVLREGSTQPGDIASSVFSGNDLAQAIQVLGRGSIPAGVTELAPPFSIEEEERLAQAAVGALDLGRQSREKAFEIAKNLAEFIKQELKNKFRGIPAVDKRKLRNAILIGAGGVLLAGGVTFGITQGGTYVEEAGKSIQHAVSGVQQAISGPQITGEIPQDSITPPQPDIVEPTASSGEIIPKHMLIPETSTGGETPILSPLSEVPNP